jgi:pyruvate/2-oxoglutarate dehydrogenase complex dihydrolipoamide acyltransferase (E2) component
MRLALQMPSVGPQLQGGRVINWSRAPGETFGFGDEICVVSIEQVVALRKTQKASILTSRRRKKKMRDEIETRETSGLHYQLVASEEGVVMEHLVPVGGEMKVGDVLAVLGSGEDGNDTTTTDPASLPPIRVVANPVDPEEE